VERREGKGGEIEREVIGWWKRERERERERDQVFS